MKDGLPSNNCNAILQDRQGYIWIGTDNGLMKYGGHHSKIFTYKEDDRFSLSNNWVSALLEDSDGYLWVGTKGGGLNLYDPKKESFTRFRHDKKDTTSISCDVIISVFQDTKKRIWIGTQDGLNLLSADKKSFKLWKNYSPCVDCNHFVNTITEDNRGNLWVGDEDHGLFYFDVLEESFSTPQKSYEGYQEFTTSRFVNDLKYIDGFLWVGTDNGLARLNTKKRRYEKFISNKNSSEINIDYHIRKIYQGEGNDLWISTSGSGLVYCNRSTGDFEALKTNLTQPKGLSSNSIAEVFLDYSNNLWIATRSGGVDKFDMKNLVFLTKSKIYGNRNSLIDNEVRAIYQDADSNLWIGTDNGLSRYHMRLDSFTNYRNDFNFGPDAIAPRIRTIFESEKGILWVSTIDKGLYRFDPSKNSFLLDKEYSKKTEKYDLRHANCSYEIQPNTMWFGTEGTGLLQYNLLTKELIRVFNQNTKTKALVKNSISCILKKSDHEIWLGSNEGLILYNYLTSDYRIWQNIPSDSNSLVGNKIRSLYQDDDGILWVGSRSGLSKFDIQEGKFKQFTKKSGLRNEIIFGILPDDKTNIWLITSYGVSKLNPEKETFDNFDIPGNNHLNKGGKALGLDGKIIVGGTNGFTIFYPDEIQHNPYVPKLSISAFKVNGNQTKLSKVNDHLSQIELSYDKNNLTFEFSALEFTDITQNQYKCFLEGFDKDWQNHGNASEVTFTNLDPDHYTFHLKVSNNDGLWNPKSVSVGILITPPWWATWFAYLLYLVLGASTLYAIIALRTSYLNRQREALTILVLERTRELKEKNERIEIQADELLIYNENLEKLVRHRTAELTRKNKTLSKYAFLNAHSLRVPVANIKGVIQLLKTDRSEDELTELIHILRSQSDNLDQVLYDIQKMLENDQYLRDVD